jgi:L-ascorbate metabolism protein UlaG (beta-lactamase superfamily)
MKKAILFLVIAASLSATLSAGGGDEMDPDVFMETSVIWYGNSMLGMGIGEEWVMTDINSVPSSYSGGCIVLYTHDHGDHYNAAAAKSMLDRGATIVAPFAIPGGKLIKAGQKMKVGTIEIEAVPAYNVKKTQFHPKSKGYVGYLIRGSGLTVYVAGDTERIPEMKKFTADVAFVPLGQTYTMNSVDEAAQAVLDVKAKVAAGYHCGQGAAEGKAGDTDKFASLLEGKVSVWELALYE